MPVTITHLGHSGFLLAAGKHTVAVDPFLTDNPVAVHKPADIAPTHIAVSHGHSDHFGDCVELSTKHNAPLIANYEVTELARARGVTHLEPMNPGGQITTDFGWVALTQAFHSSSIDGQYAGMPCGIVLHIGGVTFYHTGDTALFSDMRLIGEIYRPDIAMICAGDRFTMGPQLATRAAEFIRPKAAIPIHWGTWPPLAQEKDIREHFKPAGVEVRVMKAGEVWKYG